jgi:hypothetical protein
MVVVKKNLENFGTKNTQKIHLFPKYLEIDKSQKSELYTTIKTNFYARKKIREKKIILRPVKNYPRHAFSKKAEKTDFEQLCKAQISFS